MNKDKTILLTEQKDGFWLYDTTRGMNLSMRAETSEAAFRSALLYYQNRLAKVEQELTGLHLALDSFINTVRPDQEDF
jgi:hypothetical protein